MLAHTWNQIGGGSVAQQCQASASLDARLIVDGYSDGQGREGGREAF
jgi:hypothetical protein